MPLQNLRRRIDAVEERHNDVHDDNGRSQLFGKFNRLMAVRRFSHHLCLLDSSEQEPQAFSHHVVIVRKKDSDFAHLAVTVGEWVSTRLFEAALTFTHFAQMHAVEPSLNTALNERATGNVKCWD